MSIKERIDALRKGKKGIEEARENGGVDANAVILGRYLQGCVPADEFGPDVEIKTTDDIIADLADMADLTQTDVNRVLATLGYTPGRNTSGAFGWMLKRIKL